MRIEGTLEARDGTRMAFTAWLPADAGSSPAVVVRTPYGRERFDTGPGNRLVDAGYALVAVDVRGRGGSGGLWRPWVSDGTDGYDVIEYVAEQPWCDGNVATYGGSYDAVTQWWAAVHHPPHLRCMIPISVSPLHDAGWLGRSNGVVMPYWLWWLSFLEALTPGSVDIDWTSVMGSPATDMARVAGVSEHSWQAYLAGEIGYGAASWAIDPRQVHVPVFVTNGLWDDPKTLELWQALEDSPRAADHRLLVGPWDHAGNAAPRPVLGGVDVSAGLSDPVANWIGFLDRWMGRADHGSDDESRVQICRTGVWRWEDHAQWPPNGTPWQATVHGGEWFHDPSHPVTLGGDSSDLAWADAPLDPAALETRDDVLTLDLPPVADSRSVNGFPIVMLDVEQASAGTVVCWLTDVGPDGSGLRLGLWPTAARHPGGRSQLQLKLAPIHHEVQAGHRLRLGLASSFSPIYEHAREGMMVRVHEASLSLLEG